MLGALSSWRTHGTGASRQVFDFAARQGWRLVVSPWVQREIRDNLANKRPMPLAPGPRCADESPSRAMNSPSTGRLPST